MACGHLETRPVCAAAASSSHFAAAGCTPPPHPHGPPALLLPAPAPACGLPAAPWSPRPQHTALPLLAVGLPGGRAPLPARDGVGGQWSAGSAPRMAFSGAPGPSCPNLLCSDIQLPKPFLPTPGPHRRMTPHPSRHGVRPLGAVLSLTSSQPISLSPSHPSCP